MAFFRPLLSACLLATALSGCGEVEPAPGAETAQPELISDAGREYIWQTEHHVNLLQEHGLARLAAALGSRDGAALQSAFPPDFHGRVPSPKAEDSQFQSEAFSVRSSLLQEDSDTPSLDRGQFVRWLLNQLATFAPGDLKVGTHIITLSPLDPANLGSAWSGTGKIEISTRSDDGGLAELVLYIRFNLADLSQERLKKPGWFTSMDVTRSLAGETAAPLMRNVTAERGIPHDMFWDNWKAPQQQRLTNTGGVYLNDFNKDGFHDLFVTDLKTSFFFIGGPGGKFREATQQLDIRGDLGGGFAAFVDIDGDGWEDLVHGIAQHPDGFRIYQNLQGQFFKDVTSQSNLPGFLLGMSIEEAREMMRRKEPAKIQQKPTGLAIADYDLDGMVDLYVTRGAAGSFKSGSWIDGKAGKLANNQLLRNLGGWQFEDVTGGAPLDGGQRSTSNAVWLHADDDLRPDLYVIDEFGDGILLANRDDGRFEGIPLNDKPTDFGSMGMTAGDINNDGHPDIYIGEMYSKAGQRVMGNIPPGTYDEEVTTKLERLVDGSQLYLGSGDMRFVPAGIAMGVNAVGWAWGPCLADLNNDGWLDLYATAGFISQDRGKPDG